MSQPATTQVNTKHYELTPDLETGNDLIDSEHRTLFDAINQLLDACASGSGRKQMNASIQFLVDYVGEHFSDEEELQKKCEYPHYKPHHTFHIHYKQKIRELANELRGGEATIEKLGAINQLVGILIRHIQVEDKRLANFVKGHEV